jgi:pimeloyl-ACP methyl ester carboxylesterase
VIPDSKTIVLRDADGLEFAGTFWDAGRSSSLLVVHGLLGTRMLREIVLVGEALATRYDVLAIDVRGHGDSPGRFTWGREEWKQVDAAARFLAAPGRGVAAVGFSYGGYHLVRASARGAPLARLILVGAPADMRVLDHFPFGPKLWRHVPAVLRRGRRRLRAERPPRREEGALRDDELAQVRVPVLVVHGGDDWLISARHADRLVAALPDARLWVVPRGFHGEYLVDSHGEALIAAIAAFVGPRVSLDPAG